MIETIKRTFQGFRSSFSRQELDSHITFCSNNDPRSNQFFDGRNIDVFLEDLFKVGLLGNIIKTRKGSTRPVYLYMGHHNFDTYDIMCVHRSLWNELGLEAPQTVISRQLDRPGRQRR